MPRLVPGTTRLPWFRVHRPSGVALLKSSGTPLAPPAAGIALLKSRGTPLAPPAAGTTLLKSGGTP